MVYLICLKYSKVSLDLRSDVPLLSRSLTSSFSETARSAAAPQADTGRHFRYLAP